MGLGPCLLILGLLHLQSGTTASCEVGWETRGDKCIDVDECTDPVCGKYAVCFNTNGSYYCLCDPGFHVNSESRTFTGIDKVCRDINECLETPNICGPKASCQNTAGSYNCTCSEGYISSNGQRVFHNATGVTCADEDECERAPPVCGRNGTCTNSPGTYTCACEPGFSTHGHSQNPCSDVDECTADPEICGKGGSCDNLEGSYTCMCGTGYSNYGNALGRCVELNCDLYKPTGSPEQTLPGLEYIVFLMRNNCLELKAGASDQLHGEMLLEKLFTKANDIMSVGPPETSHDVSALLVSVENAMRLIGPQMKQPQTRIETEHTEAELLVWRDRTPPKGPVSIATDQVTLDIDWETATGNSSYPGFATISLVSYKGLESVTNHSFPEPGDARKGHRFLINSKVVTACVSNPATEHLDKPVTFTFSHLQSRDANHTCVFWDAQRGEGVWSPRGCRKVKSNATHTACACSHLSSFAVLMSLHDIKHTFQLQVITWVGLSVSLVCLLLCIVTFRFCRSIQGTRNTIHLHLCVCLFVADLVFLAGISRTENKVGCGIVAGVLHYFFLAAFCWMLLEGVQLYRMVVLVFHTVLRPLVMFAVGYGVPAVIIAVSALANAQGYGTDSHCWLNLENGFIWSFFGPVCIIIIVNAMFFIITVWKLAQKFSSLNPDMTSLRKIKTFTVTAIAQLCVLGTMWIFGCFQFEGSTLVASYLFTIFNSLQGALVFIMHCLLSKQVREEYARLMPCICKDLSEKKKYSEFSSSNQSSSSQALRTLGSGQNTGESQI
ncbi:adhesion G protein-coupled receptor E1-like isoform X1 [Anguilla anguilla]|uniref:adhesion G protein-coupled receptor E1-like isoform X1 n=1 Tax=Anguilla anguilla TaxID=7936 RepID=UPI0015AD9D02|nr:adhesion G protein-coupled receptor E1-like isoform X1 [Anguilla anguilla]